MSHAPSDWSKTDTQAMRLEKTIRAYERGEPWALGQLRRWLDDGESPPERILAESRRRLDLARREHEAPADLQEYKKNIDRLVARIDELPRDVF